MVIISTVVLFVLLAPGLATNTQSTEKKPERTISECAAKGGECDESNGRPVCGTDDQTYPSRCHLLRVQCSGHQVSLKYRGPCKACKEARDYAIKHKAIRPPKFIPRCKPDGTYASIQCLGDTGCWCSDITGKPIENTSVRTGKPKCNEFSRANIRRSPPRNLTPNRIHRSCLQVDRADFNTNLIKVFQSEYIRSSQHQGDAGGVARGRTEGMSRQTSREKFLPPSDDLVLDWKFKLLDVNVNQVLDKSEFRELKKLIKRAVKPRRCGRAFGKFCDVNEDDRLSRTEWNNCIKRDGINRIGSENSAVGNVNGPGGLAYEQQRNNNNNIHHNLISNRDELRTNNNNNNNNHNLHNFKNVHVHSTLDDLDSESGSEDESSQRLDYDEDVDYDADDVEEYRSQDDFNHTFGSSTNFPTIHFLSPKPESPIKESESESDCLADQAAALEEQKHGGSIFYVPECTVDGRYQRVQCYRSTPYCWCVNEDSGKHIPGTSVKNSRPQCDVMYPQLRQMKGCPEPKRTEFLKNLKEFFKSHLFPNESLSSNITKWDSEEERIASLSFILLDKNKNKIWERKEWKIFRELMTSSKTLRRCGKKLPRYCDINNDKRITISEWLKCIQTQITKVGEVGAVPPSERSTMKPTTKLCGSNPTKLCGSNPLEQYLKD